MKTEQLFSEIYAIDPSTNLYMIEVALDQYSDIFSEWDPAPFKRRSLDSDLELYLEGSSEEISLKYPIELCFTIPAQIQNSQIEEEMRDSLKNSFAFKLYLIKRELKKANTQMVNCIVLGFLFLWIGATSSNRFSGEGFLSLLSEALFIGGWVFLWEAVSIFFFSNRETYHRYRIYKRLHSAPVIFRPQP